MTRIQNLAKAGFITKTGLVGSAIAEAWTTTKMLQNQTITKTGLDPEVLEDIASPTLGKVATPVITQEQEGDMVEITCETEGATIYWKGGKQKEYIEYEETLYPNLIDNSGNGGTFTISAYASLTKYDDSDVATKDVVLWSDL